MKIVQIMHYPGQGGAEQVAYMIAKHAKSNGHEVLFVFGTEGPLVERVKALGCETDFIKMPSFYSPRALFLLSKYFKKNKPDVLITHFLRENFLSVLAAGPFSPVRLFSMVHRIEPKKRVQALFNRLFSFGITSFIAVSPVAVDYLLKEGIRKNKIQLVWNGVEIDKYDSEKIRAELGVKKEKIITCVGRFMAEKEHALLLGAFSKAKLENSLLVLVGDGVLKEKMELLAGSLGIKNKVIFTGAREKAYEITGISDVYVQPSDIEVMPLSVLEAMMLEVPVLASDIDAHKVILSEGKYGTFFKTKNEADLVANLEEMFKNYNEKKVIAKKAQDYASKNYTLEKMWASLEKIFSMDI